MNLYEQQFILAYKYYLKYGHESSTPIDAAKSLLGAINISISFMLSLTSSMLIIKLTAILCDEIISFEYLAIYGILALFVIAKYLDNITWKRLNFEMLKSKKNEVKSNIWWLAIISFMCIPLSFGIIALIVTTK